MTRFPRFATSLGAMAVVVAGLLALGQQVQPSSQPAGGVRAQFGTLPGFWRLSLDRVQKDLDLTPAQIERLNQISRDYYHELRGAQDWKDWGKLTPEEQRAKSRDIADKRKQQAEAVRKQIDKVLHPQQLKALEEMHFLEIAPSVLLQPNVTKGLGITAEQQAELDKISQDLVEKFRQFQKESLDKALKVLTPEQRQNLKEEVRSRSRRE